MGHRGRVPADPGESLVEQFYRFPKADAGGAGAHDQGNQPGFPLSGRGDDVIAGCVDVAGLQSVRIRIAPQKEVVIVLRDVVVRV